MNQDIMTAIKEMKKGTKYRVAYKRNNKTVVVDGVFDGVNFDHIYLLNKVSPSKLVMPIAFENIITISEFPA